MMVVNVASIYVVDYMCLLYVCYSISRTHLVLCDKIHLSIY